MLNRFIYWLIILSSLGIVFAVITLIGHIVQSLYPLESQSTLAVMISAANKYNGSVVVISISIAYLLTLAMLSDCKRRIWDNPFYDDIWRRVLTTLPIVGMVAYFMLVLDMVDLSTKYRFVKRRSFLRFVYRISYFGTLISFLIMFAILAFIRNADLLKAIMAIEIILLFLSALSTLGLFLIAILDAMKRSQQEWEQVDFLKLINPWFWIFGLKKYYKQYLLPSTYK